MPLIKKITSKQHQLIQLQGPIYKRVNSTMGISYNNQHERSTLFVQVHLVHMNDEGFWTIDLWIKFGQHNMHTHYKNKNKKIKKILNFSFYIFQKTIYPLFFVFTTHTLQSINQQSSPTCLALTNVIPLVRVKMNCKSSKQQYIKGY